ncbi:chromosome partitioning protein ParA, partial [bacterium]|nr:chromosome partitioning protein ParA [bacterium]
EQGKVEAILNSKPEDRRAIFDEAAGISRYKQDRIETERKLQYTSQNILRIIDIMSTMGRELDTKEKQAIRAKKYFQLKNELSEIDKNLRFLKWRSLKNRQKKVDTELKEISIKNETIMKKMGSDARLLESFEEKKYEMERKISEIDRKLLDFLSQKEILREKIEKNKSIISEFDKRIIEESSLLNNDLEKKEIYDNEKLKLKESIDQVLNGMEDTEKNILIFTERKISTEQILEDLKKDSQENENIIRENDKTHYQLREDLKEVILTIINQIENKKKEYIDTEDKRLKLRKYLLDNIENFLTAIENKNLDLITTASLNEYRDYLKSFIEMEDIFRDILFDKDGMLFQKEALDGKIETTLKNNDELGDKIRENSKQIEELYNRSTETKEEIVKLEKYILEMNSKKESLNEQLKSTLRFLSETDTRINTSKKSIENIKERKNGYELEVTAL